MMASMVVGNNARFPSQWYMNRVTNCLFLLTFLTGFSPKHNSKPCMMRVIGRLTSFNYYYFGRSYYRRWRRRWCCRFSLARAVIVGWSRHLEEEDDNGFCLGGLLVWSYEQLLEKRKRGGWSENGGGRRRVIKLKDLFSYGIINGIFFGERHLLLTVSWIFNNFYSVNYFVNN